ncbi:MAG: hypothetical protein IJO13_04345 [Lachnospiraceae bacterium]|nr:hypothetical protein [Lachnospiraceae bacterium]
MKRIYVRNLTHLKNLMTTGRYFRVLNHKFRKDVEGLIRVVGHVQKNAVYSKIKDQPNHKYSLCNYEKGLRTDFEKASMYIFGETIKVREQPGSNEILYEFEVLCDD